MVVRSTVRTRLVKPLEGSIPEQVLVDWTWQCYDDHGPWDPSLGDPAPTFGWRRVVEFQVGRAELVMTEWHFGKERPLDSGPPPGRAVHAVRMPRDEPDDSAT